MHATITRTRAARRAFIKIEREAHISSQDCAVGVYGLMPAGTRSMLTDYRAVVPLVEGGLVEMERASGHVVCTAPRPIPDREILHPWLVPAAATISAWHGRRGLHGGAVTDGVHAIALVWERAKPARAHC